MTSPTPEPDVSRIVLPRGKPDYGFDNLGSLTIPAHIVIGMLRAAGGVLSWSPFDGVKLSGEKVVLYEHKDPARYVLKIEEDTP